jgi:hypothetical protein
VTLDIRDLEQRRALSRPAADAKLVQTRESEAALQRLQESAHTVFEAVGKIMPAPERDDSLNAYRVRMLWSLQDQTSLKNSEIWSTLAQRPAELDRLETRIADEAMASAHNSPVLHPVLFQDPSGRKGLEWFGKKSAWMSQFRDQPRLMTEICGEPVDWL